jgi:hypothetical protein
MTKRTIARDDLQVQDSPETRVIVLPDVLELREAEARALDDSENEQRRSRTALWLLIAVCVLNSIDALMTQTVLSHGLAVEGNPIIRSIGLFPKLILVPLAAEAVYLLKPKALWIPFVALTGVVAYTTISVFLVT